MHKFCACFNTWSYIEVKVLVAVLLSMVVFHKRVSFIKCSLPLSVIFHRRLSSFQGCLQLKIVPNKRLTWIKYYLPSNVVFQWRLSSIKGCFPLKVVFHWRVYLHQWSWSSSLKGPLPSKVILHTSQILMTSTRPCSNIQEESCCCYLFL